MRRRRGAVGKFSLPMLERSVLGNLGSRRSDVLVPPSVGVDVGVLRISGGRALVVTTDPLYVDPTLGWKDAAWFAFQVLASDFTTCGSPPQFVTLDLNLPPTAQESEVRAIMSVFSEESKRLKAAILTGHTGRYEGCSYPLVGGGTMGAVVGSERYVTAAMARPGDTLLLSKGPALETSRLLARMFPARVSKGLGGPALRSALRDFSQLSTVPEALLAARVGLRGSGVWAMHDATEGGVRGALEEMAVASHLGIDLDLSSYAPDDLTQELCRLFHVEPWSASSEGSLLVAVDPASEEKVLLEWRRAGIAGQRIGTVGKRGGEVRDRGCRLPAAAPDGFWSAVVRERRRARRV